MAEARGDIAWLSGTYLPKDEAHLSLEDRGAMFADGVYEVVRAFGGRLFEAEAHHNRLCQSMAGIGMATGPHSDELVAVSEELLGRNGLRDAQVYWQVTRGASVRSHIFDAQLSPTVFAIAYPAPALEAMPQDKPLPAVTAEDERWTNCWIKSLMLLPSTLARTRAAEQGATEAILHRDGIVTEGATSNVFIVRGGQVVTRAADRFILNGITRRVLVDIATRAGRRVEQRTFTLEELREADEVFIASTTRNVLPIGSVDGQPIGSGEVGPITRVLQRAFVELIEARCGVGAAG